MKDAGRLKPPSPFHPRTKVTGFSFSIVIMFIVEQARKPVLENGATSAIDKTLQSKGYAFKTVFELLKK
jgi:hypothetical protein